MTVFPDAAPCTTLDATYTISVPSGRFNLQLRWDFIAEGSFERIQMKQYNGRNQIELSSCDVAGLYIIYRKNRQKIGWEEYVRVILSGNPNLINW